MPYAPAKTTELVAVLDRMPQFVFEAHSTDYQPAEALNALVRDGFAILKVGPWLTFALREALYGLSHIADILVPDFSRESLPAAMERIMLASPENWQKYYPGTPDEQRVQRHFSFSDRIRYYWPTPEAQHATRTLLDVLSDKDIPRPLISQYLGQLDAEVAAGRVKPLAHDASDRQHHPCPRYLRGRDGTVGIALPERRHPPKSASYIRPMSTPFRKGRRRNLQLTC